MKKGCIYWLTIGWWWEPIHFLFASWWRKNLIVLNFFILVMILGFLVLFGIFFIGIIFVLAIVIVGIKLVRFTVKAIFNMYQTYKTNKYLGKYDKKPQTPDFNVQDPSQIYFYPIDYNDCLEQLEDNKTDTVYEQNEEPEEHPDITNFSIDKPETSVNTVSEQLVDVHRNPNKKEVIKTPQSSLMINDCKTKNNEITNENFNICKIDNVDPLFFDVGETIIQKDRASIGMIQHIFKIGFNRASSIMKQLETAGVLGIEEGIKPRKILMSYDDFQNFKANYKGSFKEYIPCHNTTFEENRFFNISTSSASNDQSIGIFTEKNSDKKQKAAIETPTSKETVKNSMSDEQALAYARICNAYLEHQEEMELYEDFFNFKIPFKDTFEEHTSSHTSIPQETSSNTTPRFMLYDNKYDYMEGHDFEQFCASILSKNGFYNISTTPASNDQGIDILATKDDVRYGIQCKRYSSDIGNHAVQEAYAGARFYDCHVAVVFTNRYFTRSAKELAQKNHVLLWDRNILNLYIKNQTP